MNKDANNDKLFNLIGESKLTMPFNDFEDTVMHKIEQVAKQKKKPSLNAVLSILFFFVSSLLGILLIASMQHSSFHLPDLTTGSTVLLLQAAFVFLFLFQLEKYIRHFITPKH
jgi:hypothetical protein